MITLVQQLEEVHTMRQNDHSETTLRYSLETSLNHFVVLKFYTYFTGCLKKKRAIRFCRNPEYIRISEYQNISETADHSFCIFIWN